MASASSFLCEEQLECSICTDLFQNPVSLPCGHNFCNACIGRHWKDKQLCQCPLCKREFSKSLKLCVNTLVREMVDNYKQDYVPGESERPTSAEDVLCDFCLHTRRKAAKTCLVCLTAYCKTHLEPHFRVATLKTHKLSDPVPKLEEKMCLKHNRILEEVGTNDQTPVCVLCANDQIHNYSERKCEDNKAQPETQMKDVHYIKLKNPKKTKKTKNSRAAPERKTEEEKKAEDEEAGSLGDVYIWFNNVLYSYSPLPLHCGFSTGRVYYDIPIETNSSWELGVVNEKMRGKRVFSTKIHGRWIVRYNSLMQCPAGCPINKIKIPDRVLLCVDYEQGVMVICHPLDRIVLFYYTNCRFRGKLFLFLSARGPLENCAQGRTPDTATKTPAFLTWIAFVTCWILLYAICKKDI